MTAEPDWWREMRGRWRKRHGRTLALGPGGAPGDDPGDDVSAWPRPVQPNAELVLPSRDAHFSFLVRVHVGCTWSGSGTPPPSPMAIAREGVVRRAKETSERRSLTECQRLRDELEIVLRRAEPVEETGVRAWAYCTAVEADPELVAAVEARDAAQRRQTMLSWQFQERELQEQRMRALLDDPLRATTWWFTDNPDKPKELEEVARSFLAVRRILEAEIGHGRDTAGALIDDFLAGASCSDWDYLMLKLTELFVQFDRHDLVQRLKVLDAEFPGDH